MNGHHRDLDSHRIAGLGRLQHPPEEQRKATAKYSFAPVLATALPADPDELPLWRNWYMGDVMDQGSWQCTDPRHSYCAYKGFCVGAGLRQFLNSGPLKINVGPTALDIYHEAQARDPWTGGGESYAGTSTHAGLKYLREIGLIETFRWAQNAQQLLQWVLTLGPVVVGTDWLTGMFDVDQHGYIEPKGEDLSLGHCYIIAAASRKYQRYTILNSWGRGERGWGKLAQRGKYRGLPDGRAYISFDAMNELVFHRYGEAASATEIGPPKDWTWKR